NHRTSLALVQG
ncbi:hypothetical protein Tco_0623510, partial [Tanacetum coccineum]